MAREVATYIRKKTFRVTKEKMPKHFTVEIALLKIFYVHTVLKLTPYQVRGSWSTLYKNTRLCSGPSLFWSDCGSSGC